MIVMIMIITIFVGKSYGKTPTRKSSYEVDERDVCVEGKGYSYFLICTQLC